MTTHQITFFSVDNGDAVLLEAHGKTVMTDIRYRAGCTDDDDDFNDFAPTIRDACDNDQLDVFVLTHPDEDHLLGFSEVFHLGDPDKRDSDPDEGDVSIVVDEIWCSPYAADPNYTTDTSKPVLDEIARRKALMGTPAGSKAGNRLRILTATNGAAESLAPGVEWRLLAPTVEEADIPKATGDQPKNSSNPSSLVIQWSVKVGGKVSKIVLGGDSTVDVWERINHDYNFDQKNWNVLLAPHHCSRHSMGRAVKKDGKESFEWSDDAYNGLNNPVGSSPHIVSSSRKFTEKTPPNPLARDRYHKMLAQGAAVNDAVRSRFRVTAGKKGEKAKDIVFRLTSLGPVLSIAGTGAAAGATPASAGGGGYG
ncbi:hypothetical protein [Oceanicaulis sp. UBA2681]|uniref:hypothetical protein n=1 Tax=Oceanicaulis sp. UBA2681 TaxID=1947007 RepID=UPI00257F34DD|nr:hypothetical protein [Oceanicaulis sp. UBA2681]